MLSSRSGLKTALLALVVALTSLVASATPAHAAPVNDNFSAATLLPATGRLTQSNIGATAEAGEPASITGTPYATAWFKWVAPATRRTTFDTEQSPLDTVLSIYTGTALNNLVEVAADDDGFSCDDAQSFIEFPAVQGTTYYIQLGTWDAADTSASLRLTWNGGWTGRPANDDLAAATVVNNTANSRVTGSSLDSTSEPSIPSDVDTRSVWYKFTAAFPVEVTVAITDGINNNAYGAFKPENEADLFRGTPPNLQLVDYASSGFPGSTTLLTGEVLYVAVQSDLCTTGNFALNFTLASMAPPSAPPAIGALAGDGVALVVFTPPTNVGGGPVTSYTVRNNSGAIVATGAASPVPVTGLANGVPVAFTVAANNTWGQSAPSGLSNTVTPNAGLAVAFTAGIAPTVIGTYTSLLGDYNGDGMDDVLLYRAGTATDRLLYGQANNRFVNGPAININGTFTPLVGDFDGDDKSDVFWYAPGTAGEYIWYGANGASAFTVTPALSINGTYRPVLGDYNNDQRTDMMLYAAGTASDFLWFGAARGTQFTKATPPSISGTYLPLPGDFNGDGRTDIVWYGPGTATDALWYATGSAPYFVRGTSPAANSAFIPVLGDFNGDDVSDIFWYLPGTGAELQWTGTVFGFLAQPGRTINGSYNPVPGDFNGDGITDILLNGSAGADYLWRGTDAGFTNGPTVSFGSGTPLAGRFNNDQRSDLFFYYATGTDALYLGV